MALWGNTDNYAGRPKFTYPSKVTFNVTAVASNQINLPRNRMNTGDALIYSNGGGTSITGLTSGNTYYVIRIDNDNIKLASSYANAIAGSALTISGGVGTAHTLVNANIFFVDETEAQLKANHDKGINGAGWWKFVNYIDTDGNTRYKTELLVAMDVTAANAGDAADDLIAADVENAITITVQPANQTSSSGAATFSVTASATTGTLTYQWQKAVSGSNKFANVSGATSSSLVLSGQTSANTGDRYRVVINSTPQGAPAVTSASATLTFGT